MTVSFSGTPLQQRLARRFFYGWAIVVVAMLGSLDDFTVYFALAASGRFTWYELCVGTVCGCAVLALVVAAPPTSASSGRALFFPFRGARG